MQQQRAVVLVILLVCFVQLTEAGLYFLLLVQEAEGFGGGVTHPTLCLLTLRFHGVDETHARVVKGAHGTRNGCGRQRRRRRRQGCFRRRWRRGSESLVTAGLGQLGMAGLARWSKWCRGEIFNLGVNERVLGKVSQYATAGHLLQHIMTHDVRWILCLKIGVKIVAVLSRLVKSAVSRRGFILALTLHDRP